MSNGSDRYTRILRQYWGHSAFRGIQRDIIESIGSGHDTLGLMPTGGGKSITFQVPALAAEGVCIVITPLIALMKDQVYNLRRRGILAAAIYSGMTRHEILRTLENCILGSTKVLYVSPERIASELFKTKLRHMKVSFITVDEAHCISQWGYDFRPSYLHIADIRQIKPEAPLLALTATATRQVADDIQEKLKFKDGNMFRMSFERKNLAYIVRHATDKRGEMLHILRSVRGSAIVYVRSRKRASEISGWLEENGVEATFYHAGLEHSVKDERQKLWHDDVKRVMVATNAFGMGIDKPDVRVVIHFDCPSSLEAYFQEAGRAGRDGMKSYAVMLYNGSDDTKLQKRIADEFPEKEYIRSVYDHLAGFFQIAVNNGCGHTFMFDIRKFCRTYKLFPVQTDAALKILERAGYIEYNTDPNSDPRIVFLISRHHLYMLNELSPLEDRLITTLLRNYGSLFIDYTYIDEDMIAAQAGLTSQQIYLLLKGLTQKRILHFVPRSKTPFITYTRDRVDGEDLIITRDVYEDRKEQFAKRINTVIGYATNDNVCRSRQLLRYFDEPRSTDCGQCDVCLAHKRMPDTERLLRDARDMITALLDDRKRHHLTELLSLRLPSDALDTALEQLIAEETIHVESSYVYIED
ncbi:RecQ family ATP-dependent DNA helicase [Leyella lascolaii]|uniref:ATP-dependent DNA helicase RecQ n=1 Tax=Leyella lascolaii TaxID=1776379 RepID=A0AAW7JKD4_9BACT|nr:ATP-dependent DNA helicase RecQ [Leyella lascolaii]MDN0026314.1 ATP-dependent DNA helicase RecQ [Leyella lascolaii]